MKIIRHSRKMSVYSLSLLLSTQQISCMHLDDIPAAFPDQKSQQQLGTMLLGHDNVDALIDTTQSALGGVEEDSTSTHYFSITLLERGLGAGKVCSARQLEAVLAEIQHQRQEYDDAFLFNWGKYWNKRDNKRVVRNNFLSTVSDAYTKRSDKLNPDTRIIRNLPKSASDIDAMSIIRYLQTEFGGMQGRDSLRCLHLQPGYSIMNATKDEPAQYTSTVSAVLQAVNLMHDRFENPPCCLSLWGRGEIESRDRIFLRTHIVPYCYFIARQNRLKALALSKPMPAAPQEPQPPQQQQQSTLPYASPSITIHLGGSQGNPPPFAALSYPPNPSPFLQGAGSGLDSRQQQ